MSTKFQSSVVFDLFRWSDTNTDIEVEYHLLGANGVMIKMAYYNFFQAIRSF